VVERVNCFKLKISAMGSDLAALRDGSLLKHVAMRSAVDICPIVGAY
jgi:hypothetical protein